MHIDIGSIKKGQSSKFNYQPCNAQLPEETASVLEAKAGESHPGQAVGQAGLSLRQVQNLENLLTRPVPTL